MTFDVAYIPPDVLHKKDYICVVIDALRASSTITMLFDKGCKEVRLTDDVESFISENKKGERDKSLLVCAEHVLGFCLDGADFSPSLAGLKEFDSMCDHEILMQTTNGTVAVHTLIDRGITNILIGCMRNSEAVMRCAIGMAQKTGLDILIVCAGRHNGKSYTIDDAYAAGNLVKHGKEIADSEGVDVILNDSAKLALFTLAAFPDSYSAFDASASGNVMRNIQCFDDIHLCSMDNVSESVPMVCGSNESGQLILRTADEKITVNAGGTHVQDSNIK